MARVLGFVNRARLASPLADTQHDQLEGQRFDGSAYRAGESQQSRGLFSTDDGSPHHAHRHHARGHPVCVHRDCRGDGVRGLGSAVAEPDGS